MTMTTGQKVMYTGEKRSARIHGTSGVWGGGGGGGGGGGLRYGLVVPVRRLGCTYEN